MFWGNSRKAHSVPASKFPWNPTRQSFSLQWLYLSVGGNSQPAWDLGSSPVPDFPQSLNLDVTPLSVSWFMMIIFFHLSLMRLVGVWLQQRWLVWAWSWGWCTCMIRVFFLCQGRKPGTEGKNPVEDSYCITTFGCSLWSQTAWVQIFLLLLPS